MARTKTVVEHEDINLHISKIRFWSILGVLFLVMIGYIHCDFVVKTTDDAGYFEEISHFENFIIMLQNVIIFCIYFIGIIWLFKCFCVNKWVGL